MQIRASRIRRAAGVSLLSAVLFATPLVNRKLLPSLQGETFASGGSETLHPRPGKRGERPKPYRDGIQSPAIVRSVKGGFALPSAAGRGRELGRVTPRLVSLAAPAVVGPEGCTELTKPDALRMFLPATPDNHRSPPL